MDVRRFGIGHRRQEGPAGTRGVSGQPIHGDERGAIAELAFRPHAAIAPHTNPSLAYFVVIEGGGFVQVGEEVGRVGAGEAVVWPPNVVHAAWTELTPMRAIVVEFASEAAMSRLPEGAAAERQAAEPHAAGRPVAQGRAAEPNAAEPGPAGGSLAPKLAVLPPDRDSAEEEPW